MIIMFEVIFVRVIVPFNAGFSVTVCDFRDFCIALQWPDRIDVVMSNDVNAYFTDLIDHGADPYDLYKRLAPRLSYLCGGGEGIVFPDLSVCISKIKQ